MKRLSLTFLLSVAGAAGCTSRADVPMPDAEQGYVVDIVTPGMSFRAPAEAPSGWLTFRMRNDSPYEHFAVLQRYPEGRTVEDGRREVVPVFQEAMALINAGRAGEGFKVFERLPAWFRDITFLGGPGLLAPGETTSTTVYLEPGTYMMECYVKTNGQFHPMQHQLVVRNDSAGAPAPEPTQRLRITESGLEVPASLPAGRHTFAVEFAHQQVHENFLQTDVHVARLPDRMPLDSLGWWMDWVNVGGLETPAPAHFLGGTHEMPAGSTSYFSVDLAPGRYVFVSEVPRPGSKGLLKVVEVGAATSAPE